MSNALTLRLVACFRGWIVPGPATDRITFVCTSHRRVDSGGAATVNGGDWAYCPGGEANSEPHRWAAVEPATLEEVSRGFVTMASSPAFADQQEAAPEPEASEAS
jgi:hypothetical protein